ncbi:MAG: TRAP transporter large permease [Planctomycetes bacterium]|nr:TRAP transporter large permease [Planctomycetota bacterium]
MPIDSGLILAFLLLAILAVSTIPLAAAVFFAGVLLVSVNTNHLSPDLLQAYSLSVRLNSPALISIPLFALAGELAVAGGITRRLLAVADVIGGRGRITLGLRVVLGCALFASVSGVGPAAVSAEGSRLIPEMTRAGYRRETAAGIIACAASLAIIIPASIPLTIYAATVGMSTNIVFTASLVPGIVVAGSLATAILVHATVRLPGGGTRRPDRRRFVGKAIPSLAMPILVLTALFTGFLTAPEAAAGAATYALAVGALLHRQLDGGAIRRACGRAAVSASAVLLLAAVGGLFTTVLEESGFSHHLGEILYRTAGGRTGAILFLNASLLLAGCFLDLPAIISLLVPILLPLAVRCGLSLPHFGAMVATNLAIGLVTPPQASNITAAAAVAGVDRRQVGRAALPFLAAMLFALLLVALVPEVSLWLPRLLGWPT